MYGRKIGPNKDNFIPWLIAKQDPSSLFMMQPFISAAALDKHNSVCQLSTDFGNYNKQHTNIYYILNSIMKIFSTNPDPVHSQLCEFQTFQICQAT